MDEILKTSDDIRRRIDELAAVITEDYKDVNGLQLISLLNGGSVFCSDLMRKIKIPTELHHFGFNSIPSNDDTGSVEISLDVKESLFEKDILLVEGLVITGRTPKYLLEYFSQRKPKSIEICAIGIKPALVDSNLNVKYRLFDFNDEWVAGFGIGEGVQRSKDFLFDVRKN